MSVLPPQWPAPPPYWPSGHPEASFSALAAPVIPPLDPDDLSPFPSPDGPSAFSALAASPPRRRPTYPQVAAPHVPGPMPSTFTGIPPRNDKPLDREGLLEVLDFLSTLLPARFNNGQQIRLVIHGGAVMLLNTQLAQLATETAATDDRAPQRTSTRDIDYIARSFASEWAQRYGIYDANDRLRQCALETAQHFGLGADWLNSDADVALPMATDSSTGAQYDPIHAASLQTGDSLNVYTSPNGRLKLLSVTPFWTVALKMVRYSPTDRSDICILLRSGTRARAMHWTPARLELWLLGACWAMGYAGYDAERVRTMRARMVEVVDEVNRWDPEALADDGRGGTVPLRPHTSFGMYAQPPAQMYGYPGGGDARFRSPSHSPRASTFPPSGSLPFVLDPAPTPPPKRKNKKGKAAVKRAPTAWPGHPASPNWTLVQHQWDADPGSPERWNAAVAKEKKGIAGWLPFLKRSRSTPALHTPKRKDGRRRRDDDYDTDTDTDTDSEWDSESDWDSDTEDLQREQLKWQGMGGAMGHGVGAFQHSVADFMSSGMPPVAVAAPPVMAAGAGHGGVLPGWNMPGAPLHMQSQPAPWAAHSSRSWVSHSQTQSPQPWAPHSQRHTPQPPPWVSQSQPQSPQPWTSHAQAQSPPPPAWMAYAAGRAPPWAPHPQSHTPQPQPQQQQQPGWAYTGHRSPAAQAWAYYAYGNGAVPQRYRSPPGPGVGADMNNVAAGMNALGLYGV